MIRKGKVWKIGDSIGVTDLVSEKYDKLGMGHQWDECAKHVLEDIEPDFVKSVRKGDIVVAGENLGIGHAHYYFAAIHGCERAGVGLLLADSVNAIFLRSAIDSGFPIWPVKGISSLVNSNDELEVDLKEGIAKNLTSGKNLRFKPVSDVVLAIIRAGGSEPWALRRVGAIEM